VRKIKQNSYVLFFYNHTKKWLQKISKNETLHTHIGVLRHSDAIGKEYGSRIYTNKDKYVYLLEPTTFDFISKIQHGTQIVYPKDLGYIMARTGIQSGQKVVEIGTGSASLTTFVLAMELQVNSTLFSRVDLNEDTRHNLALMRESSPESNTRTFS